MIFLLKPPFSAGISWLAMFDYQRASASVQHRNCFRIHTTSTKKTYRQVAQRVLHIANTIHLTKGLLVEDDGSCSRIFSATTNEFTYTQLGWWLSLTLEVFGEAWNTAYPPRNGRFEFGKWWLTAKIEGVSNNFKQTICIHTSYIYTYISYIISLSHYIPPSMYGFSMLFCSGHQAKCSTVFFKSRTSRSQEMCECPKMWQREPQRRTSRRAQSYSRAVVRPGDSNWTATRWAKWGRILWKS